MTNFRFHLRGYNHRDPIGVVALSCPYRDDRNGSMLEMIWSHHADECAAIALNV
jgi:hypothetical protein